MEREIQSTKSKALNINLDKTIYGTLAEIGGGQEVARAFFQAGGASGTIAKSISAYDKTFSDHLYNEGKPDRYVSEERLHKMLHHEYGELVTLLSDKHEHDTRFFAFANTVETINFSKTTQGHGWLGVKFDMNERGRANEVVIHVNLHENDTLLQQYTLGTLGVNLIWACFHCIDRPNTFLQSLMDNLDTDRIEVTMIRVCGPDLAWVDNRLFGVQLVKNGMTNAIIFDRHGEIRQPSDMLYKKNVLAVRGRFRPISYLGVDMLKTSYAIFKTDPEYSRDSTLALCEITLNNLLHEGEIDERDFLDRVNLLNAMGQNVMISNFREYYKLVSYFSNFKLKKLRIVIGIPTFRRVFDKQYYQNLKGGILEAFGRLFPTNTKLYIYPELDKESGKIIHSEDLELPPDIEPLYMYLKANRKILEITKANVHRLHIQPAELLEKIQKNDPQWESMVPKFVGANIKRHQLFGYKAENTENDKKQ